MAKNHYMETVLNATYYQRLGFLERKGIRVTLTCLGFPVQFEGTVNGKAYYYRARHGEWRLTVADTLDDAIMETKGSQTWEGDDEYYGLRPPQIALLDIWNCLKSQPII